MGYLAQGMTEDEVIKEMQLRSIKDYNDIKKRMYDIETHRHADRTNNQLFIDYMINQKACLEDLDAAIRTYRDTNQANAMVGAIRAKSDIVDKIVKRGEELGVLRKENNGVKIIAGLDITGLTNLDIKLRIKAELQQLDQLTRGPIIDVMPEDDIIVAPALPPMIDYDTPVRRKRTTPPVVRHKR